MGSPAYFGKLANFEASLRKPGMVAFGLFNAQDNLGFVADFPAAAQTLVPQTVAFSTTPAFDASTGDILSITLTANVTSSTLNYGGSSTIPTGTRVYLRIVQDATGGRAFAFPANLHTDSGFAVDQTASRITVLPIRWNGSNWEFFSQPFSVAP